MRRIALLLVAALLFGACSRPDPPSSPPPQAEAPPAELAGTLFRAEAYHPAGPSVKVDGSEPVTLTWYPIHLLFTFMGGVDRKAVEKALQVEGPAPTLQRWEQDSLYVSLPDDREGPWQFRLPNVAYDGKTGFAAEVRRVRENVAKVTVMGEDMDSPHQPISSAGGQVWDISGTIARGLPLRPVEMVVEFAYPVRRETLEQSICDRLAADAAKPAKELGLRFDWESDRKVAITVPPLSREVMVNWTGARDTEGLHLWTSGYTLVFSGGRRLLAVEPATGKTEVLRTFDRAFDGALLSPDGRRLAVIPQPVAEHPQQVWIIDLQTGDWQETGKEASDPRWLEWVTPDQLTVNYPAAEYRHMKRSPDGRWLAEVTLDNSATAQTPGAPRPSLPGFLLLTDQVSGAVQRYPLHVAPSKYCCVMPSLVWSNDSSKLALVDALSPQRQVIAVDIQRGGPTPLAATDRLPRDSWGPSGWSPDGRSLVYAGLLIREGQVEELENAWSFAYPWSPDGRFLLYSTADRDEGDRLWVYDLAQYEKRALVQGVLVGWLKDGRALVNEGATPAGFQPPGI